MDSVEYVEYCQRCGQFGFFTTEDSFLCPECHASTTGVPIPTPSDDDERREKYADAYTYPHAQREEWTSADDLKYESDGVWYGDDMRYNFEDDENGYIDDGYGEA